MTNNNEPSIEDAGNARRRFLNALPFYINGTLTQHEQQRVMDYLQQHPEIQGAIEWHEELQQRVQLTTDARLAAIPATIGLAGLRRKLREAQDDTNWLSLFWRKLASASWLPTGFVTAAILVVVQGTILSVFLSQQSSVTEPLVRSAIEVPQKEKVAYLRVNFNADVKERDLRLLLIEAGAHIVDGPGQLGDYIIAVPFQRKHEAMRQLETSAIIEMVNAIDQLPKSQ